MWRMVNYFKFCGTRGQPHRFRGHKKSDTSDVALLLSGRRDSNSRPSAWKADALSTELFPRKVGRAGFEPTKAEPTDLQSAPFDRFGISPFD